MSLLVSGFTCKYRAFLSYSHADKAWADWLYKTLETYRVPSRLVGTQTAMGMIPRRLTPVFRDSTELASATDLGGTVNAALAQSEALIVICSPNAARSRWVDAEVRAFKRMGRGPRVFCVIVGGEPGAGGWPGHEDEECFCPALRFVIDEFGGLTREPAEPIAADARPGKDGKAVAKMKLIAGLLGVGFDTLAQRETHRRRRRLLAITAASVVGMTIASGLAVSAYVARNEARQRQAQTEDALNYMLGDLHDKLEGTGRLDLLAAVDEKALALFAARKPGSLSDHELAQQSKALVQIGSIRYDQGRYGAAMDAFRNAQQQTAELTRRHPGSGQFLYDRAQAEYWVGWAYWKQGKPADAEVWLTRYRDSTRALLSIDPRNRDWQLEASYGEHNLGVLALERGELDAAQSAFQAELVTQRELLAAQPDDQNLTVDVADTISWLGRVAAQHGNLAEAQRLAREQAHQMLVLRTRYPDDFRWLEAFANAQKLLGDSLAIVGRNAEGQRIFAGADAAYQTLTEHDPTNVSWQVGRANVGLGRAWLAFADDRPDEARMLALAALDRMRALGPAAKQGDGRIPQARGRGWRLLATIALQQGDLEAAMDAAGKALAEANVRTESGGDADIDAVATRADALVTLGMVQQAQSPGTNPPVWAEAKALLAARAANSHYWHVLDPWLRLCRLTADATCAQTALDRLNASGYVPLQPWPAIADRSIPVANQGSQNAH